MGNKSYWDTTRKIVLVINYVSLDDVQKHRDAIKSVGLNINDSTVLAIVPSKKEAQVLTEMHSVVYASPQEIGILGKWKNDAVVKTLEAQCDLLVVLGTQSPKIQKQLRRVHASMSVGINTNVDFLTIDLNSEQTAPTQLLNFAKNTLEKIN